MAEICRCTRDDFDAIVRDVADFWGSERTLPLHHPMFVQEFGDSAFVVREGGRVLAYLFGFLSQVAPVGYIHLVGVRAGHRRRGLARLLYARFAEFAAGRGCRELKAITTPGNRESIAFHTALGFEARLVPDYAGPGQDRVVFLKAL